MKKHRNVFIVLLAVLAIFTLASCSDGKETTATVRVRGAAIANTRSTSSESFGAAKVTVNSTDITSSLRKTSEGKGNDTVYEAQVETPEMLVYSVKPKAGFVFDEWEIDEDRINRVYKTEKDKERVKYELEKAIDDDDYAEESQSITIKAEYAQFLIPTFDRGFHLDPTAAEGGDGSADKPYKVLPDLTKWKEEELTIKIRNTEYTTNLDFSYYVPTADDDGEIEFELKIIGGFDSNWALAQGTRSKLGSTTIVSLSNYEEFEIEFKNIDFNSKPSFSSSSTSEVEIEFENCTEKGISIPDND